MGSDLKDKLVEFAEMQSNIIGVSEGIDSEESFPVYYFLVKGSYDEELVDKISDLDIKLSKEGYKCNLAEFPVGVDEVSKYEFLGEVFWREG